MTKSTTRPAADKGAVPPQRQHSAPESAPVEEALQNFSLILAHRLRGLVTSIEGFNDLLIETLATREQRELALRIFESTVSIERILADLQRYSQAVEPVPQPVFVHDVIREMLATLEDLEAARITIDVGVGRECLTEADPVLVVQALLVLVQNALDATQRGGQVALEVARDEEEACLVFDVWNDGCIDAPDAAQEVFEPFYTTKASNLGVGLSIARRIVEAHDGTLALAANDSEAGVCFRMTLPYAPPDLSGSLIR